MLQTVGSFLVFGLSLALAFVFPTPPTPLPPQTASAFTTQISLIYTSNVAGNLFEVDGDARPCARNKTSGRFMESGNYSADSGHWSLAQCGGGLAGRLNFFNEFYKSKADAGTINAISSGQNNTVTIDTGNHFYGSREFFHLGAKRIAKYSRTLGYDAFVLSADDLHATQNDIKNFLKHVQSPDSLDVPFVASNLIVENPSTLPSNASILAKMIDAGEIKPYHIVEVGSNTATPYQVVIFSLMPQTAVVKSRSYVAGETQVGILSQWASSDEWLMSQVSHLNRLWEDASDSIEQSGPSGSVYTILVADLPEIQLQRMLRVLSFVDLGIGTQASVSTVLNLVTSKSQNKCNPESFSMNSTSCRPMNGQPSFVRGLTGVERSGALPGAYYFIPTTEPLDVATNNLENVTYMSTRHGRAVGIFEHNLSQTFDQISDGSNPKGSMFQIGKGTFPVWPVSFRGLIPNGKWQEWLHRREQSIESQLNLIAINMASDHDSVSRNGSGNVSQPVYGEPLGSIVYEDVSSRETGCQQGDCPVSRLILQSMLYAAYTERLCNVTSSTEKQNDAISTPICLALVDPSMISQSLSAFGSPWRDGKALGDQYDPRDILGIRDEQKESLELINKKLDDYGGLNTFEQLNAVGDEEFDEEGDLRLDEKLKAKHKEDERRQNDLEKKIESCSAMYCEGADVDIGSCLDHYCDYGDYVYQTPWIYTAGFTESHGSGSGLGSGSGSGYGYGSGSGAVPPPQHSLRRILDDSNKYSERGEEDVPTKGKFDPNLSFYKITEDDIRAAIPTSTVNRKSEQLYYADMTLARFKDLFLSSPTAWKFHTQNFGAMIGSDSSIPYAPSWRIRRNNGIWERIDDVYSGQRIRIIGTYRDLLYGPYFDKYMHDVASTSNEDAGKGGRGKPPSWEKNHMRTISKPILQSSQSPQMGWDIVRSIFEFLSKAGYRSDTLKARELYPWETIIGDADDRISYREALKQTYAYIPEVTDECVKASANLEDSLLGSECAIVFYNPQVPPYVPYITPGLQPIVVPLPLRHNSSAIPPLGHDARFVNTGSYIASQIDNWIQEIQDDSALLPRTKIGIRRLAEFQESQFDSWEYFRENFLIGKYAPTEKVGNSLPAVLGPYSASERIRWKKLASSLSDQFIQLRYDTCSEKPGSDLDAQSTGQTFFFGNTREDRALAVKTLLHEHNWTHVVVLHESTYANDSSISCATLQRDFGCNCSSAASSVDPEQTSRIKFWCLNIDSNLIDETISTPEEPGAKILEPKILPGGAINHSIQMLHRVPHLHDSASRQKQDSFLRESFINETSGRRRTLLQEAPCEALPNIVFLAIDDREKLVKVRQAAMAAQIWTSQGRRRSGDSNRVWIVHKSENVQILNNGVNGSSRSNSNNDEIMNILGIGRLALGKERGGLESVDATVDESIILAYEASFAFLLTIHRVFTWLSSPGYLLPPTGINSRAQFLSGSVNPLESSVPIVHDRLADLIASNIDRPVYNEAGNVENGTKFLRITKNETKLLGDITMNGVSNITRCPLFEVVGMSSSGEFRHQASVTFQCGTAVYQRTGKHSYPVYTKGAHYYARLPSDSFRHGGFINYALLFYLILIPVCFCFAYFVIYQYKRRLLQRARYKALMEAKSSAWRINASHIQVERIVGEGAFGTVYKGYFNTTPVAIKKFKDTSQNERGSSDAEFVTELVMLMDVRHTHITQLIGAIMADDNKNSVNWHGRAIVSEFLEGGDVETLLHGPGSKSRPPITTYNLVKIARDAARGMTYLHTQGIVHKDLKPANMLLDGPVDASSRFKCKIADFGCSKQKDLHINMHKAQHRKSQGKQMLSELQQSSGDLFNSSQTRLLAMEKNFESLGNFQVPYKTSGTLLESGGTALYLPPELQLEGKNGGYEKHGDVFAFGIVLGQLITKRVPYSEHGIGANTVILRVAEGLRPITPGTPSVPPDIHDNPMHSLYQLAKKCWLPQSGTSISGPKDWAGRPVFHYEDSNAEKRNIETLDRQLEKLLLQCKPAENQDNGGFHEGNFDQKHTVTQEQKLSEILAWSGMSWWDNRTFLLEDSVNENQHAGWGVLHSDSYDKETVHSICSWLHTPAKANVDPDGNEYVWSLDATLLSETQMSGRGSGKLLSLRRSRNQARQHPDEYILSAVSSKPDYFVKTVYIEHLADDADEQLCKEMALLRRMHHVNILPFVGASNFEDGDVWQFDMVYGGHVEPENESDNKGPMLEPLASLLAMKRTINLVDLLDIATQVACALDWLHCPAKIGGAVVHGNINWGSILVGKVVAASSKSPSSREAPALTSARSPGRWTVKLSSLCLSVIDGCAYDEENVYENDQNMPAWVAPEVHLGNECTVAADVYSFGILLWCIMTRRVPFDSIPDRKIGQIVLSKKARPEYSFDELNCLPCQNTYMNLMTSCWENKPALRPSIRTVLKEVSAIHKVIRTMGLITKSWRQRSRTNSSLKLAKAIKSEENENQLAVGSTNRPVSSNMDPLEEVVLEMTEVKKNDT